VHRGAVTTRVTRSEPRGRHKIFLGMAAGVGKTFRMLQEGHTQLENGHDVVIGLVESHSRANTAELAEGFEILARRRVTYRGVSLEEMDLPGILLRAPDVCLINELAHTNAPGLDHEKRYQDVEDVLAAGIDVISTVNVQHLDSLDDRIAELTGITIRETIPDRVLAAADEVVLIDISPETLLDRLRAGKIYPPERIETALNHFFRIETLAALREIALRQVAEEVEAKRFDVEAVQAREDLVAADAPQAVGERLMALVEPYPGSQRLVRRAWRSAQRLGSELDLLWVNRPGRPLTPEQDTALAALSHDALPPRTRGRHPSRQRRARHTDAGLPRDRASDAPAGEPCPTSVVNRDAAARDHRTTSDRPRNRRRLPGASRTHLPPRARQTPRTRTIRPGDHLRHQ
jgi:two-component system, OmpR family, sensor histidine kinase KdpD